MSKNSPTSYQIYTRLLAYVKPYKFAFVLAMIGNLMYGLVDAAFIKLFQPLLDEGFVAKDQTFIRWIPVIVVAIFVGRGLASFMSRYFMGWLGRRVVMDFRQLMFRQLLRLPTAFYDKNTSGELLAKITYNVEQVANACTDAVTDVVRESFTAICLLTVMLSISWKLTLMFMFMAPLMSFIMTIVSRRLKRISTRVQDSVGTVTHVAEEAIEGQKIIKAFGGQIFEMNQFDKASQHNRRQEMKLLVTSSLSVPLVQFVGAIGLALVVVFATLDSTSMTPGGFAALVSAMIAILKPIKMLTKVNSNIQRGIAGAASIFAFLDETAEKDTGTLEVPRVQGAIEYIDVNFHYESRKVKKRTLNDISFSVKPGETIALVGRSGSGKSTVVSLLPRFYEFDGEILIDGIPITNYSLTNLRKHISIVSQQVVLFNDTIYNNIAYGMDKATLEEVKQAAESAHALEFIEKLPEGFETVVGENGVRLSGGQRQRLAIARAILKHAPILILDEATSSLDTESERKIQDALDKLMKQSTTLVIAHRLSTIENAHRIIVMDDGEITEIGTHQELIRSKGLYASLRDLQYQDSAIELA